VKSYVCTRCHGSITVGHPIGLFRKQAVALARETTSWAARLLHRGSTVQRFIDAMVQRHYLEPGHVRDRPTACPHCGFRGQGDLPWWEPGVASP